MMLELMYMTSVCINDSPSFSLSLPLSLCVCVWACVCERVNLSGNYCNLLQHFIEEWRQRWTKKVGQDTAVSVCMFVCIYTKYMCLCVCVCCFMKVIEKVLRCGLMVRYIDSRHGKFTLTEMHKTLHDWLLRPVGDFSLSSVTASKFSVCDVLKTTSTLIVKIKCRLFLFSFVVTILTHSLFYTHLPLRPRATSSRAGRALRQTLCPSPFVTALKKHLKSCVQLLIHKKITTKILQFLYNWCFPLPVSVLFFSFNCLFADIIFLSCPVCQPWSAVW